MVVWRYLKRTGVFQMAEQNINIAVDTHTHTLASGHAYNTLREMARMAADKGLSGLAVTEHAPEMPGTCHSFYFQNMRVIPRNMYGIELLMGVELNVMDENGSVDLPESLIRELDIAIASIHVPCYKDVLGRAEITQTYINVMEKDYIDIIGHPDDGRVPVDYEVLVKEAKRTGTLLEVNNSSLRPGGFRQDTRHNAACMLRLCKKYETMVVLGSDAHMDVDIANCRYSMEVVDETGFPEELVANTSLEKLKACLKRNKKL